MTSLKAGKKYIKVKWKKLSKKNQKKVKSIQVQYSKDETFKTDVKTKRVSSKKTEVKLKNLKSGQKYYVRIRAYTKDGKTINVSKWSPYKSKKAK